MVHESVERFPETAPGNFPFEFVSTNLNLSRENSLFGGGKCSSQLVFVEPALIQLFELIPPSRGGSTDQIHGITAGWFRWIGVTQQIADTVFFSLEDVVRQN